jgi:hypothetical protein
MSEYETETGLIVVEKNGHSSEPANLEGHLARLRGDLERSENNVEIYKESLAELELSLEDVGWQRLSGFGDREFSEAGLRKIRRLARLNFLKNPLIRHAVLIQCYYVWGQGVTVSASDDAVNRLIQKFLEDPKNITTFSGHQARLNLEQDLQTEGELFGAMFTNQSSGRVIVRRFVPDEITEIITNPNDYQEPWFYKRIWTRREFSFESGLQSVDDNVTYHPDWRLLYNAGEDEDIPTRDNCPTINDKEVLWDAPIYHIKVGGFGDQKRGCPEVYSALDWAKAVKDDLEDYATIRRAHSRFAWKQTVKGGRAAVSNAKAKLGTTMNANGTGQIETNPPPVSGSIFVQSEGAGDLTPMKTAGMMPSPEEGRRLWLMISAGLGIPETMMSGNADVGSYATAKTLDRPTELQMENRRQLWTDVFLDIFKYVIDMAIKCPNGMLKGETVTDDYLNELTYVLKDEGDREIEIRFPSILRHEVFPLIQAITMAITLGGHQGVSAGLIDDRTATAMLMSALGENDFDDMLDQMYPGNEFVFNAGYKGPPGADDSSVGLPPRAPVKIGGGAGGPDPDMGGSPSSGQDGGGMNIDPMAAQDLMMALSRKIQESMGGPKRRKGSNRSGFSYEKKIKEVKVGS